MVKSTHIIAHSDCCLAEEGRQEERQKSQSLNEQNEVKVVWSHLTPALTTSEPKSSPNC